MRALTEHDDDLVLLHSIAHCLVNGRYSALRYTISNSRYLDVLGGEAASRLMPLCECVVLKVVV